MDSGEVRVVDEITGGEKKWWRKARPAHIIDALDIAWVAGLIEGEGCFLISSDRYPKVQFQLSMCDEDVVRHAASILGVGTVCVKKPGVRSIKLQWSWRVTAQAEVAWVMDLVYPLMGIRRQQKIDELRISLPSWATGKDE